MNFKQTGSQVARGARADFETNDKLILFKNVAVLRATYQIRLLLYRAVQEKKKLVISLPSGSQLDSDLGALIKSYRKNIEIKRA